MPFVRLRLESRRLKILARRGTIGTEVQFRWIARERFTYIFVSLIVLALVCLICHVGAAAVIAILQIE